MKPFVLSVWKITKIHSSNGENSHGIIFDESLLVAALPMKRFMLRFQRTEKYFWIKYEMIITVGIYLIKAIFPCSSNGWNTEAKKALSRATWMDWRCLYIQARACYNENHNIVHPNPKIRSGCCWQLPHE